MDTIDPIKQAKIDALKARRLSTAPLSWRGTIKRAWAGNSRKTAIRSFCGECLGFERAAITDCTAYACPLYKWRPFQTSRKGQDVTE